MALTRKGKLLVSTALLFAVLAALWPSDWQIPGFTKKASSSCPLGYAVDDPAAADVELPDNHPDVVGRPAKKTPTVQLLLFRDAVVFTAVEGEAPAEALLVDQGSGSILGVGTYAQVRSLADAEVLRRTTGPKPVLEEHRLGGRFIMPGFVDCHVHFLQAGLFLTQANLWPATSQAAFEQIVSEHAQKLAAQEQAAAGSTGGTAQLGWLRGGQWDEGRWGGGPLPHRSWLDRAAPGRPVLLSRADSHMAVASSAALAAAGITRDTPDPEGGTIDRDASGEPSGVLREAAIGLVARLIPPPSPAQLAAALKAASSYALSRGVTTVGDLGRAPFTGDLNTTWQDLEEVLLPAADRGDLRMRVAAYTPLAMWQRTAAFVEARGRAHMGGFLFWGGVKEFADGSLGSRTALMWEPYSDAGAVEGGHGPSEYGTRMLAPEVLYERVAGADDAGLQVAVHAIGDRAVDEVTAVFERVTTQGSAAKAAAEAAEAAASPHGSRSEEALLKEAQKQAHEKKNPLRHRIEHAQHLSGPEAVKRMAEAGVLAITNPLHLLSDAELMGRRLGPLRAGPGHSYALRTLASAGVPQGLASDWPVVDLEPLLGVYVAALRRTPPGGSAPDGWGEVEAMGPEAALRGHTVGCAHALHLDDYVGLLKPGMRADFVVLDSSPLALAPGSALPSVMQTWVDAKCAYGCGSTSKDGAAFKSASS